MLSKYLLRLICYSLLIGPIPIVCLGFITISFSLNSFSDRTNEMNRQILHQHKEHVEQMMRTLELSVAQFAQSPSVKSAIAKPIQSDDFTTIQDLWVNLYNLQTYVDIEKAYLVSFKHNWVMESGPKVRFGPLEGAAELERFESYLRSKAYMSWIPMNEGADRASVQLVTKLPLADSSLLPDGMVVVQVGGDQLNSLLPTSEGEYFFVFDGAGMSITGASYQDVEAKGIYEVLANVEAQEEHRESGSFTIRNGSKEWNVSLLESPQYGWKYVFLKPVRSIWEQMGRMLLLVLALYLVFFVVVLLTAVLGSRHMYSPIRRLYSLTKQLLPETQQAAVELPQDEFKQMEDRVQQLLDSKLELQQQLKGHFVHLKEYLLLKLFTGQISAADFMTRASAYGLPVQGSCYGILVLQVDTFEGSQYKEEERDLLMVAINKLVGEALPAEQRFPPILLDAKSQVTLVPCYTEDPEQAKLHMDQLASQMRETVTKMIQLPIRIGISPVFTDLGDTAEAYGQAKMEDSLQEDPEQNQNIAGKIVQWIHERYDQDLSLQTCADTFHYNPSYISRVFKKHTGMAYMDYVIAYRLTKAKWYLEFTTMSVADIAQKLQYMHTSAFIRVFRKLVGVTPGQYRDGVRSPDKEWSQGEMG